MIIAIKIFWSQKLNAYRFRVDRSNGNRTYFTIGCSQKRQKLYSSWDVSRHWMPGDAFKKLKEFEKPFFRGDCKPLEWKKENQNRSKPRILYRPARTIDELSVGDRKDFSQWLKDYKNGYLSHRPRLRDFLVPVLS